MGTKKILIIDDDITLRKCLQKAFEQQGYCVDLSESCSEAYAKITKTSYNLAIVDLFLSDGDGLQILEKLNPQHTPSIMLSGHGNIDTAIEATRKGAFHFITKPFEIKELLCLSKKALKYSDICEQNTKLLSQKGSAVSGLIGKSSKISFVIDMIHKVSNTDATVLITGESGTGKELVAKAIHKTSFRNKYQFQALNCNAVPKDLLESELFGHVKGAFTGSIQDRKGCFELSHKGTLFIDEIGDLDMNLQVKLLRVLQNNEFVPVGGTSTVKIDSRVIVATHVNLTEAIKKNQFREDLFYRLNILPIHLPPLRERKEDISLLTHYFIKKFSKKYEKQTESVSYEVMDRLENYPWPGNVRELENLLERLIVLNNVTQIKLMHLPEPYMKKQPPIYPKVLLPEEGVSLNSYIKSCEVQLILQALKKTGWNKNQASKLLKINRTTLVEKIKKLNLVQLKGPASSPQNL